MVLRIWYIGVSASFSLSKRTFKADMDFVVLSCAVKVRIRFSLDFAMLLKSLMDFITDLFMTLFGMGSIKVDCSAGAVGRSQAAAPSGPMGAAGLGAAATEAALYVVRHPHGRAVQVDPMLTPSTPTIHP